MTKFATYYCIVAIQFVYNIFTTIIAKENDTDFFWLGLGKQPAFMRYGGSRERAPQNPLFVCASAWLCIPEMSGRIKNSVGPVGLKTVLMTVVTTGLLTVGILFACIC